MATYTFTGQCYSQSGDTKKYDGSLSLSTNYGTITNPSGISTAINGIYNYSGTLTYNDSVTSDTTVTITSNYHSVSKTWSFTIEAPKGGTVHLILSSSCKDAYNDKGTLEAWVYSSVEVVSSTVPTGTYWTFTYKVFWEQDETNPDDDRDTQIFMTDVTVTNSNGIGLVNGSKTYLTVNDNHYRGPSITDSYYPTTYDGNGYTVNFIIDDEKI